MCQLINLILMQSLQKLLPGNRANLKPGVFSCHSLVSRPPPSDSSFHQSRTNTTQDTTIHKQAPPPTVNMQQLQLLQQQFQQVIKQNTPSKSKSIKGRTQKHMSVDPSKIINKAPKSSDKKQTPKAKVQTQPQSRSGKKLTFATSNQPVKNDSDTILNTCNQIGNIIIENILNKDDYYDKMKKENTDLKDIQANYQRQIHELKRSLQQSELFNREVKETLDLERSKYHKELLKFQEKLGVVKQLQTSVQIERQKVDQQSQTLKEQQSMISTCKNLLSNIALSSVDYLSMFQNAIESTSRDFESTIARVVALLKNSLQIVFEVISKTQQLKLPALSNCHIEDFDFESFFSLIESLNTQAMEFKGPMSDTIPNDSLRESQDDLGSQELSFRQKPQTSTTSQMQISLPLSQVQKQSMIPSKNISLQEQFHTFLEDDKMEEMPMQVQVGSPYFTHHNLPMQMQESKDMPLQITHLNKKKQALENNAQMLILQNNQNRFQTEFSDTNRTNDLASERAKQVQTDTIKAKTKSIENFHSFNKNTKQMDHISVVHHQENSEHDATFYDSLFQEMNHNEPKKNSMHTLKYLDQQVNRSFENSKGIIKELSTKSTQEADRQKKRVSSSQDKENRTTNERRSIHCHKLAIAIHDFKAVKSDNISFVKGDRIIVYKMNKNGWWLGKQNQSIYIQGLCNGVQGYFPNNYVVLQDQEF